MSSASLPVRKVAVLGAGVMGAQIAAHFANCNVPVLLFELAAPGTDPNANVLKAVENLHKLEPSPLSVPGKATHTAHTCVLGSPPNSLVHPQNILVAVESSTWTSMPITGS